MTIAGGGKKVGDSVITTIDRDIGRRHAPPITGLHIGTFADRHLHSRNIISLDRREQHAGSITFFSKTLSGERGLG